MKIESEEMIDRFYQQVKDRYPELTREQLKEICFGPWNFLKSEMENGELEEVRLKYFGTFQVYPGRAKNMLHNLKQRFKYHKIEPKQYFKLKGMLEKFLSKHDG